MLETFPKKETTTEQAEKVKDLTFMEKKKVKLKAYLRRLAIASSVAAVLGSAGGKLSQHIERSVTKFDPEKNSELIEESDSEIRQLESEINKNKEIKTNTTEETWLKKIKTGIEKLENETLEKGKNKVRETEIQFYELKSSLYKMFGLLDKGAFLIPALILFLALGKFTMKKIKASADPVEKARFERLAKAVNEIQDRLQELEAKQSITPLLSKAEIDRLKGIMESVNPDLNLTSESN